MRREAIVILFGILITAGALVGIGFVLKMRQAAEGADQNIDLAANLAAEGEWEQVIEILSPYGDGAPTAAQTDQTWRLLAEAHTALGDQARATTLWERLAEEGEDLGLRGSARLGLAMAEIEGGGDLAVAESHLDEIEGLGVPGMGDRLLHARALVADAQGDRDDAHDLLRRARRQYPDSEIREPIEERLSEINLAILYSRQPREGVDELYQIQSGDTLDALGRRFGVSAALIEAVNHVNPRNLTIGRRIKIPRYEFRIEVYKREHEVVIFDGDDFFVRYPCRVGREEYMTPEDTFHVARLVRGPTWTDPQTGRRYPPGDPGNELGTRWLGFEENPSLGIHGTIHPESIGSDASSGCIGLLSEDVEQMFDLIPRGTEVTIFASRAEAARERGSRD